MIFQNFFNPFKGFNIYLTSDLPLLFVNDILLLIGNMVMIIGLQKYTKPAE